MFSANAIKLSSPTRLATAVSSFFQIQLLSVSAGSSVSATGVYGATAEKGVAHELLWHLAVDGRIF